MTKTIEIIVVFAVLVIFVLLYASFSYLPGEGAFSKIKSALQSVIDSAPKVTYGEKDITASKPSLQNPQQEKEIKKLQETISKMKSSVKKYCFASYGGFTPFEEGGTSLAITYDREHDETKFEIRSGVGGRQLVRELGFSVQEIVPCVIGGSSMITKAFERSFLTTDSWIDKGDRIELNHYNSVPQIMINHEGISYGQGVYDFFEDGGLLYTPDNRHICFFPTVDYAIRCIADANRAGGLDDDCLGEAAGKENSIPEQLKKGTLQEC